MSHALFDAIKAEKGVAHDVQLSELLGLSRAQINRYRHDREPITAALILRIYDFSGFSIERIRELAADTATPRAPVVREKKPAKVSQPRQPAAPQIAAPKPAKLVVPTVPVVPFRVTTTKAPQWVSRVHRSL